MILIRFSGEIAIKSRNTRARFQVRLAENLRQALATEGYEGRVERQWSRFLVDTRDPAAAVALARVFGVSSVSVAERRPWESHEDTVRQATTYFAPKVSGRRFAVRARCTGNHHRGRPSTSAIERDLGAALLSRSAGVDLDNPEVTAFVELHPDAVYLFSERIPGPGGLPLGVEGRALSLISGGFDSAVASWTMLKRGVGLDYVFFNLGGAAHREGVLRVLDVLTQRWSYGDRPSLVEIDFRPLVAELEAKIRPRYWQIVLKRLMVKAAREVAGQRHLPALVTGEAVGQVSSQTLHNLAAISRAVELPILRPLVGFNKEEIVTIARRIGTFEPSAEVKEYCALAARYPTTRANLEVVENQQSLIDPRLLEHALARYRRIDLRSYDPGSLPRSPTPLGEVPEEATVIDLRERSAYDEWHIPGALHLDFFTALRAYPSFTRRGLYVLYCEVGLKSSQLAEEMREAGFDAHHLEGGIRAIRRRYDRTPQKGRESASGTLGDTGFPKAVQ